MTNLKEVLLSFSGVFIIVFTVIVVMTGVYLIWIHSQLAESRKTMHRIEKYQQNKEKKSKRNRAEESEDMLTKIDTRIVIKKENIRYDFSKDISLDN